MADVVLVRFKNQHAPYAAGEHAGFPAHRAKELVDRGQAEYVEKLKKPVSEEPPVDRAAPKIIIKK